MILDIRTYYVSHAKIKQNQNKEIKLITYKQFLILFIGVSCKAASTKKLEANKSIPKAFNTLNLTYLAYASGLGLTSIALCFCVTSNISFVKRIEPPPMLGVWYPVLIEPVPKIQNTLNQMVMVEEHIWKGFHQLLHFTLHNIM